MNKPKVSQAALQEFLAECDEVTNRVSTNLSELENDRENMECINALYRDVHTVKGSAQLFGFNRVGKLAHAIEASLLPVREERFRLSRWQVDEIFRSLDLIDKLVQSISSDGEETAALDQELKERVGGIVSSALAQVRSEAVVENEPILPSENSKEDIFESDEFIAESLPKEEVTPKVNAGARGLESSANADSPIVNFDSEPEAEEEHALSEVLKKEASAVSIDSVQPVSESGISEIINKLDLADSNAKPETKNTSETMTGKIPVTNEEGSISNHENFDSKSVESKMSISGTDSRGTIRVQVGLLDKLMNLIGEMVLVRNQVLQFSSTSDDLDFLKLSQRLDLVTSELQGEVMKTRMQPIANVVEKFRRMVRELARDLSKDIDLVLHGVETEVDKTLLEAIKDPLTHIVRNCCDHGIETPAERERSGKNSKGTVTIRSFHEGGQVIIEILDDGRGLSREKILKKAIESQIITPSAAEDLSDKEVYLLIFKPGFSTAEKVSNVSGRGVGMDVVKTNIERIGGTVELNSTPGAGSSICLKIPLTLAIVPAMIIRAADEVFAIPQVKLVELVRVEKGAETQQVEILQGRPVYRLRGDLLPLVSLEEVFVANGKKDPTPKNVQELDTVNIVVLNAEGNYFGLIVDEVLDTAEVVVKPLSQFLKTLSIFSGATIMGDGAVALILDVIGLANWVDLFKEVQEVTHDASLQANSVDSESQEFLFFRVNAPGRYSIPLCLVHRLEEFKRSSIEYSGEQAVVQYRGGILPLIHANQFLHLEESVPSDVLDEGQTEKVSVIVLQKRGRNYGIVVNEILDVAAVEGQVDDSLRDREGIMGNILLMKKWSSSWTLLGLFRVLMIHI